MAVSKRLRFEILRRDNHRCRYCGATPLESELHVDHVIPVALGGTDDPSNLVTACITCNRGKASIAPDAELVADVQADALRWAAAMEVATARRRADLRALNSDINFFDIAWDELTDVPTERDRNWRSSIERFLVAGLDRTELWNLLGESLEYPSRDPWRFFCGRCWAEIRLRQEAAAAILAESGDR